MDDYEKRSVSEMFQQSEFCEIKNNKKSKKKQKKILQNIGARGNDNFGGIMTGRIEKTVGPNTSSALEII